MNFQHAATILRVEVATIQAVYDVESTGAGFFNGRPKILFEGHWFHKFTKGIYDSTNPTISYPSWTKKYYARNQIGEWKRYQEAASLHEIAARLSTSWGAFQIMGFNHALCEYPTVTAFVMAMHTDEETHLIAFCNYVANTGLADELQRHDWNKFAYLYNGPAYQKNNYAGKLEAAYWRHNGEGRIT
jgi:hypothetical protein